MIDEPYASAALWSKRLGLFAIPVTLIAVLAQRSGRLDFLPAVTALGSGLLLAACAVGLGVIAFAIIWVRGNRGAASASLGVIAGLAVLAAPLYFIVQAWGLPAVIDIATDPATPPGFVFAAAERRPGDNPLAYPGERAAVAQMSAFADIVPLRVSQPPDETHALALQLVEQRGWRILDPGYTSRRIEAVATSPILKMQDDIIITVTPDGSGSRLDMRSASRTGRHDLGRNAARIRAFMAELSATAR